MPPESIEQKYREALLKQYEGYRENPHHIPHSVQKTVTHVQEPVRFNDGGYLPDSLEQAYQRALYEQYLGQGNTGWTPEAVANYGKPPVTPKNPLAATETYRLPTGSRPLAGIEGAEQNILNDVSNAKIAAQTAQEQQAAAELQSLQEKYITGKYGKAAGEAAATGEKASALKGVTSLLGRAGKFLPYLGAGAEAVGAYNAYSSGEKQEPNIMTRAARETLAKHGDFGNTAIANNVFGYTQGVQQPQPAPAPVQEKAAPTMVTPDTTVSATNKPVPTIAKPTTPTSTQPETDFNFANPDKAASDILGEPAKAKTDPELYNWALKYRSQHPLAPTQYQGAGAVAQSAPTGITGLNMDEINKAKYGEGELDPAQQMQRYKDLMGENSGIDKLQARLDKRDKETAEYARQAPWMALLQGSLATLGGTSPFAGVNIGKGMQTGVENYAQSMHHLQGMQDKADELQTQLESAKRAEQVAAAKYGIDSAEHNKAYNKTLGIEALKFNIDNALKNRELDIKNQEMLNHGEYLRAMADKAEAYGSGAGSDFRKSVLFNAIGMADKNVDNLRLNLNGIRAAMPYDKKDEDIAKAQAELDNAVTGFNNLIQNMTAEFPETKGAFVPKPTNNVVPSSQNGVFMIGQRATPN